MTFVAYPRSIQNLKLDKISILIHITIVMFNENNVYYLQMFIEMVVVGEVM